MTIVKPKPLAEFQPPWEAKGEDYDPEKGKAFIHYLMTEAWNAQQATVKVTKDLTTVTEERDTLAGQIDSTKRANETDLEKITRERDEARAEATKAKAPDPEKLRLEVALEKGLTASQAKRLVGTTKEELASDADVLISELAPPKDPEDGGDGANPRTQPPGSRRNPADPDPTSGKWDVEKLASEYVGNRSLF